MTTDLQSRLCYNLHYWLVLFHVPTRPPPCCFWQPTLAIAIAVLNLMCKHNTYYYEYYTISHTRLSAIESYPHSKKGATQPVTLLSMMPTLVNPEEPLHAWSGS